MLIALQEIRELKQHTNGRRACDRRGPHALGARPRRLAASGLHGALAGGGPGRDAAPARDGHARRQPLPRHALQLLRPVLRVAEGDRLLHEEGRRSLLGRDVEPDLPGRVLDRHGAGAHRARRVGHAGLVGGERASSRSAISTGTTAWHYLTRRPDEILTRVQVPDLTGWRSTYWKLRRRGSFDFPVLGVAAAVRLDRAGAVVDARIVLGAVSSRPIVADKAAASLVGKPLTDDAIAEAADLAFVVAKPMDNTDFALVWRKRVTRDFVTYALREVRGDDMRATRRPDRAAGPRRVVGIDSRTFIRALLGATPRFATTGGFAGSARFATGRRTTGSETHSSVRQVQGTCLTLVNLFDFQLAVRQAATFGPGNLDCSAVVPRVSRKEADLRQARSLDPPYPSYRRVLFRPVEPTSAFQTRPRLRLRLACPSIFSPFSSASLPDSAR